MQRLDTFFVAHEETAYNNFTKATKSEPKLNLPNVVFFFKEKICQFQGYVEVNFKSLLNMRAECYFCMTPPIVPLIAIKIVLGYYMFKSIYGYGPGSAVGGERWSR